MPHAILLGSIDLHAYAAAHEPAALRDAEGVHTSGAIYVAPDGQRAVLEATSQSYGRVRRYWLALQHRESRGRAEVAIGIHGVESPAITPGLIRVIEALVRGVMAKFPDAVIDRTNLPSFAPDGTSGELPSSLHGALERNRALD